MLVLAIVFINEVTGVFTIVAVTYKAAMWSSV